MIKFRKGWKEVIIPTMPSICHKSYVLLNFFFLFQIYLNIFFKNSKPTLFHIIFIFRDRFIFLTETNKQENIWEKEFLQRIRDYYTKLLIIVYNVYIAHNVYNCLYMFKKIICYVFFFSTFNVILRIRNQF